MCDSILTPNDCDDTDEHPGKIQDCPADKQNGCFINESEIHFSCIHYYNTLTCYNTLSVLIDYKSKVVRGCTALDHEDEYKCEVHSAGSHVSMHWAMVYRKLVV